MHGTKENLQLQTGLPGILSEIALNNKGGEESNVSSRDSASWDKAFSLWLHWLHVAEDVLRARVFRWQWEPEHVSLFYLFRGPVGWFGCGVVGGLLCCCVCFCFLLLDPFLSILGSIQISSIGCKDCHCRDDARSNSPTKKHSLRRLDWSKNGVCIPTTWMRMTWWRVVEKKKDHYNFQMTSWLSLMAKQL